jgi:hypothetical protein
MADTSDRDRSANRRWWIDALDPVENLRTLANVQDFGRMAAEELADRLQARGDGRDGMPVGAALSDAELDRLVRRFQAEAVRAADAWADLAALFATLVGGLAGRLGRRPVPPAGASPVALKVTPGRMATAVFYVHNTAGVPVPAVRPHCTPPRSHLGRELAGDAVRFDPEVLDPLPARSSCGIEVRCHVPPGSAPGSYASVILVSNVPELYLPLQVTVAGEEVEG